MSIVIIYPAHKHSAYKIAAETFADLAKKVSSCETVLITDADPLPDDNSPVVVIGADSVNHHAADLFLTRKIDDFGIQYNTDSYRIYTQSIQQRQYLFIAGGRPRATLYATYRYFEKFCGCRWFWDGDRINHTQLPFEDVDLTETPRFQYRGLRYFAHRSLHRFQAEHWSLEDWQKEIEWLLKKRLNMFMLRIGMDDIFQKAFPDIVPYPKLDAPLPEAGIDHHDRNLFWSLEYRGALRKKLLAYAFERDLMHPEDCGTITHWYSRTPKVYLEKVKPTLLNSTKYNGEATGQTWDILDDENLNSYFKLTDTHIREYGKPELFHTIGLAERSFSADKEENMRLKLYVYRRIAAQLKEKYPGAPLFIAAWDIWMFWTPEEVKRLLDELDPSQAILLDYTSDTMSDSNFTTWGILGKFPWVFGIFSGYEPDNEIRGFYELTNERIKIAKEDPMCKGAILWPELSHGDTFMTEYLAYNAWNKDTPSIDEMVQKYCHDRYSEEKYNDMLAIWRTFMPVVQMRSWSPSNSRTMFWGQNTFVWMIERATFEDKPYPYLGRSPEEAASHQMQAVQVLTQLARIVPDDDMLRRDICDIARTVIGRYVDCAIRLAEIRYLNKDSRMKEAMDASLGLIYALRDVLATHEDFSLLESLQHLQSVTETNPNFEKTLKINAAGYYCRSFITENVSYLYIPEMKIIFDEVQKSVASGNDIDREAITARMQENKDRFLTTSLTEMAAKNIPDLETTLRNAAQIIQSMDFE